MSFLFEVKFNLKVNDIPLDNILGIRIFFLEL